MRARAVGLRAGSFSRQERMTDSSGSPIPAVSGSPERTRAIRAAWLGAAKASLPVAANTITAPQAKTSTAGVRRSPSSCSGAMYPTVPMTPLAVTEVASTARAMPKSITRGPSAASRMFSGLRSRWTTPAPWIAASAVAVDTASRCRPAPLRGPSAATAAASVGPSMYSEAIQGRGDSRSASTIGAMQNPLTLRACSTSAANRRRMSASSAQAAWRNLTATRRPSPDSPR